MKELLLLLGVERVLDLLLAGVGFVVFGARVLGRRSCDTTSVLTEPGLLDRPCRPFILAEHERVPHSC